jgi:hypothetical protein
MSPTSSDASMLAVAVPTPLRPTLLAVDSCTRQYANLLVPGQIVSDLASACNTPRGIDKHFCESFACMVPNNMRISPKSQLGFACMQVC